MAAREQRLTGRSSGNGKGNDPEWASDLTAEQKEPTLYSLCDVALECGSLDGRPLSLKFSGASWHNEKGVVMYEEEDELAPSVEASLCRLCGVWYGWDEPHGIFVGGCGADALRKEW